MHDDLGTAHAKLVKALLDRRVVEGFDARGLRATSNILARKQRKRALHERSRQRRTWLTRLRSWWASR